MTSGIPACRRRPRQRSKFLEIPVITGIGPLSAIGSGRDHFWKALTAGKSGISVITTCDTSRSACKIGAEIRDFRISDFLDRRRIPAKRLSRAVELAIAASSLAITDADIVLDQWRSERVGVLVGTSVGALSEIFTGRDAWLKGDRLTPDTSFHVFNHAAACVLSSIFDLGGPILTVSTGCNSGLDALGQACRLIQQNIVDAMLVVGTDCELFPEFLAAMEASGSLSTRFNERPQSSPRPFDAERDGIVPGEGAAAIWIESKSFADQRKATIYGRLAGYCSAAAGKQRSDSTVADSDMSPSIRALSGAMQEAGWQPKDVDVINANGSGSVAYDRLETESFRRTFGDYFPELRAHSIKSMIGVPGGAASALQIAVSCLSLQTGIVPPTLNHDRLDSECAGLRVVRQPDHCGPEKILLHSIGLGGFYYSSAAFCAM